MAHVALYRKYRPQTFADVVGQPHVTTSLIRAIETGTWHHAYLFTGPRGTGKTSTARILAMALNASPGPTPRPDPADPIVASIREGSAPDVVEIDAASNNGVEAVRELRGSVALAPMRARVKVYVVDECHMLTPQAWNAFLKTVEEPPGHVVFVFATTEPHKVLPTILSRTQRFDFRRVPAVTLAAHCQRIADLEGLQLEPGALEQIVRAGDGSVRDTLSVLDQVVAFTGEQVTAEGVAEVLGAVPAALLDRLTQALADSDVAAVLTLVGDLAEAGTDLRQFASQTVEHLRSLLLLQAAPDARLVEGTPERLAALAAQAARTGAVDLVRTVELLGDAQIQMRRGNTRLPLEIALVKAARPDALGDEAALGARLDRLEAQLVDRAAALEAAAPAAAPEPAMPPAAALAPSPPPLAEPPAADPPAAAPTSSAVTEPAPAPTDAQPPADALAQVRHAWATVLETLKARSRKVHALVSDSEPVALEAGILTLLVPYEFHAAEAEDNGEAICHVVADVTGHRCRLATVVGSAKPTATGRTEEEAVLDSEAAGKVDDDEAHDQAVRAVAQSLSAEVLEDRR